MGLLVDNGKISVNSDRIRKFVFICPAYRLKSVLAELFTGF